MKQLAFIGTILSLLFTFYLVVFYQQYLFIARYYFCGLMITPLMEFGMVGTSLSIIVNCITLVAFIVGFIQRRRGYSVRETGALYLFVLGTPLFDLLGIAGPVEYFWASPCIGVCTRFCWFLDLFPVFLIVLVAAFCCKLVGGIGGKKLLSNYQEKSTLNG